MSEHFPHHQNLNPLVYFTRYFSQLAFILCYECSVRKLKTEEVCKFVVSLSARLCCGSFLKFAN